MKTWEYKRVYIDTTDPDFNKILNKYGSDGWELVSTYGTVNIFFIFRREV